MGELIIICVTALFITKIVCDSLISIAIIENTNNDIENERGEE